MMKQLLILSLALVAVFAEESTLPPSCDRPIYCNSTLLHHVQMARIFNDSKTFVDLHLKQDAEETLEDFDRLLNQTNNEPSKEDLIKFVEDHFDSKDELEDWTPTDYSENPAFLASIDDPALREFAKNINAIWPTLGRKVKQQVYDNPERFSFIPVQQGFIIPGGRFKELYYWDTYWIIEGLLISGMDTTVKGMIENFIDLLKQVGHIPNGSRWYYQQRSQPMLLTAMMSLYLRYTRDTAFLKKHIDDLEKELQYWLNTQQKTFTVGKNSYTLLRYFAPSTGPRPESYYEDYTDAHEVFQADERIQEFYVDIKSAAESGWDFSTRWFVKEDGEIGNLTNIHTRDIIPVDENAIFANALLNLAYFQSSLGNRLSAMHWALLARKWMDDIDSVLWNDEDGVWYDYDFKRQKHRRYFYPSNVAPLWMGAVEKEKLRAYAPRVLEYLKRSGALEFPGGVPASLMNSGEQWDFPNAWPPLVSIIVNALEAIDTNEGYELAFKAAQTWVRACHKGFQNTKQMFEKYDVMTPGGVGGGGEYTVQPGFGWSNGVVLEFLVKYGHKLTASDSDSLDNNLEVKSVSKPATQRDIKTDSSEKSSKAEGSSN